MSLVKLVRSSSCLILFSSSWLMPGPVLGADWGEFRGPTGQGHALSTRLPLEWSAEDRIVWRTEIPGKGWSSPVIDGNQIWMTTAIESAASEAEKARRLAGDASGQPMIVSGRVSLRAVGLDRSTGRIVSDIELMAEESPDPIHTLNSFASPTPLLMDGKLVAHFGANGTACLDTQTGKVLWTNRELRVKHENGAGSSPIAWRDRVIFHCDGSDQQFIVALDLHSGQVVWKTDRSGTMNDHPQMKKAYGTPLIVTIGSQPVVVSPAADWLYGYDPETGRELWKIAYGELGFSIVPRPVAGHGMVYMSTSFMQPELLAVKLESGKPEIVWRNKRQMPSQPSPLLVGEQLYVVSDKGIFSSLNAKTGETIYAERLGGNFSSSPLFAAGRIYVANREGVTYVIQPGAEFNVLATNTLPGQIMASPIAVGQTLYLRTDQALYAIE